MSNPEQPGQESTAQEEQTMSDSQQKLKNLAKDPIIDPHKPLKDPLRDPKPFKEMSKDPVFDPKGPKDIIKEPSKESFKDLSKDPVVDPKTMKELSKDLIKDHLKDSFKDPSHETVKEFSKDPIADSGKSVLGDLPHWPGIPGRPDLTNLLAQGATPFILATPSRARAAATAPSVGSSDSAPAPDLSALHDHLRHLETELAQVAVRHHQLSEAYITALYALQVAAGQAGNQ